MLRIKQNKWFQTDDAFVPLKTISISAHIRSFGAGVTITQLFRNDEKEPIEAVYCFPIEENAAIYSFTAIVGDREIRAQLKEKVQAQQEYSQALQQGHGAYLMEQDEKSEDIFIINVGSLLPGKECRIQIQYVNELILINGNQTRFVIPTTIAPRYNPTTGGISSPAGTQSKYIQSAPYTVDLICQIDKLNEQLRGVSSPSHPITIQFNEQSYQITFAQKNTFLDRDIIIDMTLSNQTNTILAIEKSASNQLALMAAFTPTTEDCQKAFKTNTEVNNEFLFVVDCSGSMQNENKIGLARQAMMLFLKSLPVHCQFNIIRFGSNYQTLFPQVTQTYNEQNAKQAEQLISIMSADLGGTELLQPLQWLQNQPPALNRSRQIFLLTDGEISNVDEVMNLCRSMSTSSRIFSFGLGHAPSRSLVKGLARSTNGRFVFIPPGTNVDTYVAEQLNKALQPSINNVKVKWNIPSLVSSNIQMAPKLPPPVYADDRLLFYALIECERFDHDTTVELWNEDQTVRLGLARIDRIPQIIDNEHQLTTRLAAKALIQEMSHEKNVPRAGSQQMRFAQAKEDDLKKRSIDISLKYNILCPYTAFIGIEKRTDPLAKNVNANMVLREVPIEIAADDKTMSSSFPRSAVRQAYINQTSTGSTTSSSPSYGPPPPLPPSRSMFSTSAFSQQMHVSFPPPLPPPPPSSGATPTFGFASFDNMLCEGPPPPPPPVFGYSPASYPQMHQFMHNQSIAAQTNVSLTSTTMAAKKWPSDDQDIVRHLINLQKFDGLWNLTNDDLENLCQKPLTSFHSNLTQDSILLTTAIVILVLEKKFNSYQTMWSFIVTKARKRLTELLGDTQKLEQFINEIQHQL